MTGQCYSIASRPTKPLGICFCRLLTVKIFVWSINCDKKVESLDLSLCHAFLDSTRGFLGPEAVDCSPLQQHHLLLCDQAQCQALAKLYASVVARTGGGTFSRIILER